MRAADRPRSSVPRWAVPASIGLWLAAATAGGAQIRAAFAHAAPTRLSDLQVYVGSAELLRHGQSLYDFTGHNAAPFTYPPWAGLLFLPLTFVNEQVLRLLWTTATVAAVLWIAAVVAKRSWVVARVPLRVAWPLVATALFLSAPISSNLRFGQITVFLILLVLYDVTAGADRRTSGALTGISAGVKLTPLIFLPLYWFAGRRRAALICGGSFILTIALAWALLPAESSRFWLMEIWDVNRVGNIDTAGNQSLNGALLRMGIAESVRTVTFGICGVAVGAVALLRAVRATRYAGGGGGAWGTGWLTAVVIVGAASIVISPVSWTHHQLWLVLAAFLPVSERFAGNLGWTVAALALMIVPVMSLAGGAPDPLGAVAQNARLLLAGAIACLVPFRTVVSPTSQGQCPPADGSAGKGTRLVVDDH